jgi:hypothetical protein
MRVSVGHAAVSGLAAGACLLVFGLAVAAPPGGLPGASALDREPRPGPRLPTPGYSSELTSLSCASASRCLAVGDFETSKQVPRDEVLGWDGHRWRMASVPEPRHWASLSGVSCPAPRHCLAVGTSAGAGGHGSRPQVLRWDGGRWSAAAAPAGVAGLSAVTCTAPSTCWALDNADYPSKTVRLTPHGWGRPAAIPGLDAPNEITCRTASNCWMAGYYVKPNGIDLYNLIMRWNGHAWTRVRAPQPTPQNELAGIACPARDDCWAAGHDDTRSGSRTRNEVLHWNGSRWSLVSTPKGPLINSELLAITCRARSDCWAAGDDSASPQTLHYNGHRWALVRAPNPHGAGFLFSIDCPATADCLAVGFDGFPPVQNLALHWNGARWTAG